MNPLKARRAPVNIPEDRDRANELLAIFRSLTDLEYPFFPLGGDKSDRHSEVMLNVVRAGNQSQFVERIIGYHSECLGMLERRSVDPSLVAMLLGNCLVFVPHLHKVSQIMAPRVIDALAWAPCVRAPDEEPIWRTIAREALIAAEWRELEATNAILAHAVPDHLISVMMICAASPEEADNEEIDDLTGRAEDGFITDGDAFSWEGSVREMDRNYYEAAVRMAIDELCLERMEKFGLYGNDRTTSKSLNDQIKDALRFQGRLDEYTDE